ncbi:MAG: formylglycine-generating enzyme family protein [Cellvibrionaceae bacterium]
MTLDLLHPLTKLARATALFVCLFLAGGTLADGSSSDQTAKKSADHRTKAPKRVVEPFTSDELSMLKESLVYVKGGDFVMGSDSGAARAREKPAHKVSLSDFYIGKTEVTQALFERVMGWNFSYYACSNCPVNNISWMNVQLFMKRLNEATGLKFRLPSEAQWEYAAKGGQKSKGYLYSGSNDIDQVAWFSENAKRKSHPVATKAANELGLYDMTGNLWEFCQDDLSRKAYQLDRGLDPILVTNSDPKAVSMKVVRGGGYEFSADESQVFTRDGMTNNVRMPDVGFRLVHPVTDKLL